MALGTAELTGPGMRESPNTNDVRSQDVRLTDPDEHLYRQVANEAFLDNDRPTYQAFMPHSESDELSVDRGSVLSPREAFENYAANGKNPVGTWPVSVEDVHDAGLSAFDDSAKPDLHAGHAYISFKDNPQETNNRRKNWRKQRAADLAHSASRHGAAYRPERPKPPEPVPQPLEFWARSPSRAT